MITTVALRNLHHSDLNVRKTDLNVELREFADDIDRHGLLQNLDVVRIPADPDMFDVPEAFEVVAGGRRHRALLLNVELGRIDLDYDVPVIIVERELGREVSLAENRRRIAMNPVDEFEAFRDIVVEHDGTREEGIHKAARRYGITEREVAQRLRLADLAPPILEALRADTISIDAAKAYASYGDHALQLTVYEAEERRAWGAKHDPKAVRDGMRSKTYPAKIAQALYVGHLAYMAAGGRIDRDLFMGADEDDKLLDPAIVDQLAREKAAGDLPGQVKIDGFGSGQLLPAFVIHAAWPKSPAGFRRSFADVAALSKKDRKLAIGVYSLRGDGSGLACIGYFEPTPQATDGTHRALPGAAMVDGMQTGQLDALREHAQENRILRRAARLVIAAIKAPALLDRMIWSNEPPMALDVDDEHDDTFLIDVQLRVTRAELEAMRAPAARELKDELVASDFAPGVEQGAAR